MQNQITMALIMSALSPPAMAQGLPIGPDRHAMTLAVADLPAGTPALARRSLRRIERAALRVCGGGEGSLRVLTDAVRASPCWRDAVDDAVRQIDAPLISRVRRNRR